MTVYEWTESEHFFVAQVRPTELFDLGTLENLPDWEEWSNPDVDGTPEGKLQAENIATKETGTFCYFFDRRVGREWAEHTIQRWPDKFTRSDSRNLALLKLT